MSSKCGKCRCISIPQTRGPEPWSAVPVVGAGSQKSPVSPSDHHQKGVRLFEAMSKTISRTARLRGAFPLASVSDGHKGRVGWPPWGKGRHRGPRLSVQVLDLALKWPSTSRSPQKLGKFAQVGLESRSPK